MPSIDIIKIIHLFVYNPKESIVFNSGFFLFLFLLFLLFYSFLRRYHACKIFYITIFSFYFYYKSSGLYIFLLLISSLMNFYIARWIFKIDNEHKRKFLLVLSVVINLGILGYFKYTNFFINTINNLTSKNFALYDIILPLGISFYTFQSLSYTIDIFRKNIEPLSNYLNFCFFISFFPKLLLGPIEKAKNFIPQIFKDASLTDADIGRGIFLIICGIFKKIAIADYIGVNFVNRVFDSPLHYSGLENLMAVYGYTLQIYCDFSGYSDMAIGLALILGYKLMDNFNSPYKSYSVTEFWRRWHISLSTWLKDYLYISLGGNRKGKIRLYLNLLITMLLAGLWHGANWKFVFWGAGHGIALVIEKFFNLQKLLNRNIILKILGVVITFHIICLLWIFFRAESFEIAWQVIIQIIYSFNGQIIFQLITGYKGFFLLMLIGYLLHFSPKSLEMKFESIIVDSNIFIKTFILIFFIWFMIQIKSTDVQPFIYFQF
jgi:alginate O-acetyltransferase complex protein AlgI